MIERGRVRWAEDGSATAVAGHIASVIDRRESVMIAVPGGSTPAVVFAALAEQQIDWSSVTVMLTDDRRVPGNHPASNQAALNRALGSTSATIASLAPGMAVPALDLLWLGMGADGHIASLFPQMDFTDRPGRQVIETVPQPLPAEAPFPRISMNMAALSQAPRETIIVVRGADKRAVLDAAIAGDSDLPIAQLISASRCAITIYWSAQ